MTEAEQFTQWKARLNALVNREIGLDVDDLPDMPYFDMFADDLTPEEALEEVLEYNEIRSVDFQTILHYTQEFDEHTDADPGL